MRHKFSMEATAFERSLRAFYRRAPFQPFVVELMNRARLDVSHPEAVAYNGGLAVYISREGIPILFDHESGSQLIGGSGSESTQAA